MKKNNFNYVKSYIEEQNYKINNTEKEIKTNEPSTTSPLDVEIHQQAYGQVVGENPLNGSGEEYPIL